MTRAGIEDAVRAWLVLAGASGGVPSAASAVVMADQDTVRPPLPYLTVRVLSYDLTVGEDEDLVDDADPPTWQPRGQRTSVVSVNGFGPTAEAWLSRAVLMLRAPSVLAQLGAAGVAVRPIGPTSNLSALLDDATQVRVERDFGVDYVQTATDEVEDLVPLEQVEHEDTWQSEAGDLVVTVTEVL